jgi:hypothetical protein
MFTIKLYDGDKSRIYEAASFTVFKESGPPTGNEWAEITAHGIPGHDDLRFDIGPSPYEPTGGNWRRAIIENRFGRTTEMLDYSDRVPGPRRAGGDALPG